MFTEKVEDFWEKNKVTICLLGGACLVIAGSKSLRHIKKLNALHNMINDGSISVMKRVVRPLFPNDMPISEIKAALDKIEGAEYADALVTFVEGKRTIYIR